MVVEGVVDSGEVTDGVSAKKMAKNSNISHVG